MDEVSDLDIEINFPNDDLRKAKEKIRKQRTSIGRCLASKSQGLNLSITESIEQIPFDTKPLAKNANQVLYASSIQTDKVILSDNSKNIDNSEKIKFYKEREMALKEELDEWKELCRNRQKEFRDAKRKYKEANSKEIRIEDSQMKNLTKEQKDFLLAKPDYNSYLQVVKDSESDFVCTMQQMMQTANMIEHFLESLKMSNDAKYAIYEKECMENKDKSTKEIIKQMIAKTSLEDANL